MGKKAGVDLYDYIYIVGRDGTMEDRQREDLVIINKHKSEIKQPHIKDERHKLEEQCAPDCGCCGWYSKFNLPGCCCRDDVEGGMCWRKQHWREELYEAMENDCLFMSITSLLIIDVLCIVSEFIVHDPNYKENDAAHLAGLYIKCTSLSILAVFQVENCTILFALQEQFFWHVGHKIDFVVIPLSIMMETQIEADVGGLLVILRFWRLIRVAHGIWEGKQKTKEDESENSDSHPEELKPHFDKAKEDMQKGHSAKDAAYHHHIGEGGDHDHFHNQEHHHEDETNEWTPEMHAHYELLTAHLDFDWEERTLHDSCIVPKFRCKIHELLDQAAVHNIISLLLVCDVLIVIIEFVVHDEVLYESHWCHEAGFYFTSASLTILGFFQAEAFMNMNASGRFLFEFYGHFLDCIIIPVSIALEFLLQGGAASLLIMLRLWRLVRIMHGVFTADEEKDEGEEKERESKREESFRHARHIVVKQKSIDVVSKAGYTSKQHKADSFSE